MSSRPIETPLIKLGYVLADQDKFIENYKITPLGNTYYWTREPGLAKRFHTNKEADDVRKLMDRRPMWVLELYETHSHYFMSPINGLRRKCPITQ